MATAAEVRAKLESMTPEEFGQFKKSFGGDSNNPAGYVSDFKGNPQKELRYCDALGLLSENEKLLQATQAMARAAEASAAAAAASAKHAGEAIQLAKDSDWLAKSNAVMALVSAIASAASALIALGAWLTSGK